jgi:hypothetical protein
LNQADFESVTERLHEYTWDFDDEDTLVEFSTRLFGLQRGTKKEVRAAIISHLKIEQEAGRVFLHWSLVYAAGRKQPMRRL